MLCCLLTVGLAMALLVGCKKKEAEAKPTTDTKQDVAGPGPGEPGGGMTFEQLQAQAGGGTGGMPGEPGMQGGMPGDPGMQGGMPGDPGMQGGMPGDPGMQGGMPGDPGMQGGMPGEGMDGGIAGVYVGHGPWGYLLLNFRQDGVVDAGMTKGQYRYENGIISLQLETGVQGNLERTEDGFRVTGAVQGMPVVCEFMRVAPFQNLQQLNGDWLMDTTVMFGPNVKTVVKRGQQQPGTIKDGMVCWGINPDAANAKPFATQPEGNTGRFSLPPQREGASEQHFTIYLGSKVMVLRRPKNEQGVVLYFVFLRRQSA